MIPDRKKRYCELRADDSTNNKQDADIYVDDRYLVGGYMVYFSIQLGMS